MNNLKKTKNNKKGKGFTTIIKSGTRLTRRQSDKLEKELENNYNKILEKLTSLEKEKIKTFAKLQAITRGKVTRKKLSKIKTQKIKEKEKHLKKIEKEKHLKELEKKLKSKNFEEIPIPLLEKILSKIFDNFNLKDEDAKNILIMSIIASPISEKFNESLKNIVKFQELILTQCQKLANILDKIIDIASGNIYPSDDEVPPENIEVGEIMMNTHKMNMSRIKKELNKLLIIRGIILKDLDNIYQIISIKDKKTNDDNFLKEFINIFSIDWLEEFDIADIHNKSDTTNINFKIHESKQFLKNMIFKVEDDFKSLLNNKLIFTKNELSEIFDIIGPIYDCITNIDFNINKK